MSMHIEAKYELCKSALANKFTECEKLREENESLKQAIRSKETLHEQACRAVHEVNIMEPLLKENAMLRDALEEIRSNATIYNKEEVYNCTTCGYNGMDEGACATCRGGYSNWIK